MKTTIEKSTARRRLWAVRIACLTLWAIRAAAGGNDAAFAPDRILVKPKAHTKESVVHLLFAKHGAHQDRILHQLDVRLIRVPPGKMATVLQKLKQDRRIEFAEPDWVLGPDTIPNDPYFGNEWHLPKIGAPAAWDITTGSSGVTIAILDSGVDSSHPDLAPLLVPGWNCVDNNADTTDVTGHGTGVAGAAASAGNNATGGAGVTWNCRIMPLRIADTNGYGSSSAIASALIWAADHGARVANISYSGVTKISSIISAAQYFQSKGGVVTASSGNESTFDVTAENPYFLLVGATDANDVIASWSNTGSNLDLTAPGVNVLTTMKGGGYGWGSGTSFSAPVVAGVAALVMSANSTLPGFQVQNLVKDTTDDLGPAGWDTTYGAGRVNAGTAVLAALSATPTNAPPPTNSTPADTTAPSASVASPTSGSSLAGTVTVAVNATDNVAVTTLECYLDGTLLGTSTNGSATFSWNTTAHANGTCTLQARAYDAAGNAGLSSLVSVSIANAVAPPADTTPPTVQILKPLNNASVSRTTKVSVTATDNVGVTRVDLYADGNFYASSTTATTTFSWNTSKLTRGQHTLQAFAYDAAGNVGASSLVTVRK